MQPLECSPLAHYLIVRLKPDLLRTSNGGSFVQQTYRDDSRMVEVGGGLGLGVEAPDVGLIGELAGEDHFQGDLAVEANLPAAKTTPMPPRASSRSIS